MVVSPSKPQRRSINLGLLEGRHFGFEGNRPKDQILSQEVPSPYRPRNVEFSGYQL